jgi:hypothetical protein
MIIIIIVYHWRRQCRSIVNLLTCNSCVALLFYVITLCVQAPSIIQSIYFDIHNTNSFFCKICACLATFGTAVLAYSYLVQAISRFFITILYKHKILLTFRTNWILIATSWIASGIIAGALFISPTAYQYEPESDFCTLTTNSFLTSFIASVIIQITTMNTMIILYGIILWHTTQHTRINPNSASTLRAKRNKKVFKNILIFVSILSVGGTPYFLCIIINRIDRAPWPLYSLAFLFISFTAAIESIALLITNDQVKTILLAKLTRRQTNAPNNVIRTRANQIVPYHIDRNNIQILPPIS